MGKLVLTAAKSPPRPLIDATVKYKMIKKQFIPIFILIIIVLIILEHGDW